MSVKQSVRTLLEQNRDVYLSGEDIASQLSVSRAAVWKAVKSLQTDGYLISAVSNKGYRLLPESDILSDAGIRFSLAPQYRDISLDIRKLTGSTNQDAKALAVAGAAAGTVVLAEAQTTGRGRLGRSFYSPAGTGLYLSVVLRPAFSFSDAVLITTAAAVATARAIESVTGLSPQIKWVNDLYLNGKKICGILTEAVSDFESGTIESVVVGIGINFRENPELPEDLRAVVGALYDESPAVTRNMLAGAVISNLLMLVESLPDRSFLQEYRTRSLVLGKSIRFLENGVWQDAVAVDLNETGGLVVETAAGRRTLSSGEISVRPVG